MSRSIRKISLKIGCVVRLRLKGAREIGGRIVHPWNGLALSTKS